MFLICTGKSKDLRKKSHIQKILSTRDRLGIVCYHWDKGKIAFIKEDKLYVRDTII